MTMLQRVRVLELLSGLAPGERFHHGDCLGADKEAHDTARSCRLFIEAHPSTLVGLRAFTDADVIHPEKPPLDRNRDIVDAVELLVAAPCGPEMQRSGTWSTVRYARKQRRRVIVFWPDGKETRE
jgi:hypothetical protein